MWLVRLIRCYESSRGTEKSEPFLWMVRERVLKTVHLSHNSYGDHCFPFSYAFAAEIKVREGEGDPVTDHIADGAPPKRPILLATTLNFLLFYDYATQRIDIHPNRAYQGCQSQKKLRRIVFQIHHKIR